ncbi:MAG: dephospho-CoA kinase [bacterium]
MSAVKKKIVVAITGTTKSGKSEVCSHLEEKYPVIDVDHLAHKLYKKGTSLYYVMKRKYGPVIIKRDKEINRRILGEIVFGDRRDYWDFTCILYPALIKALIKEIKKIKEPVVILDMAVLFESGFYTKADKIIFVRTKDKEWKKRIENESDRRYFEKIRKFQEFFPTPKKVALSDYIIHNDDDIEELQKKIDKVMAKIL